jgi:uncharacterized Zn finger protein
MTKYSAEQILEMAPDQSSIKAAKGFTNSKKWTNLSFSENSIWGECQGSAKNPYRTGIDLSNNSPAFKCNCPSRKFPCKHALALFLIYAESPSIFSPAEAPTWLQEWIGKRQKKNEKAESKEESPENKAKKAKQTEKTARQRGEKMADGLEEIGNWLEDVMTQGLGQVQNQSRDYWQQVFTRLNDQQLPGLAALIQEIQEFPQDRFWAEKTLVNLGKIHLAKNAYQNLEALEENKKRDVLTFLGVSLKQEEVLQNPDSLKIEDTWQVITKIKETDGKMKTQRTWLQGVNSKKFAMLLDFSFKGSPFKYNLESENAFDGAVVYYPSNFPQRAILEKEVKGVSKKIIGTFETWEHFLEYQAEALSQNPFLLQLPISLNNITPVFEEERLLLVDSNNDFFEVSENFDRVWEVIAFSGGESLQVFGEWRENDLYPTVISKDKRRLTL